MPPNTPVPSACCVSELAPDAMTKGTTPQVKAREVIRIGRKRSLAAATVASTKLIPSSLSILANSTIKIAFLAERPIIVIRPILKNTSFISPLVIMAMIAPKIPNGTTSITDSGIDQLS